MTPILLDIPHDPQLWPAWLEEQLVGLQLGELIDQLKLIVPEPEESQVTLDDVCGSQLDLVLTSGLSALSQKQVSTLLKSPDLLLDLQERVFIEGGDYWHSVSRTEEHQQLFETQWPQIEKSFIEVGSDSSEIPTVTSQSQQPKSSGISIRTLSLLAAVLLVGVTFWLSRPQPPAGWGFNRPGALAVDLPADEYLDHIAESAGEWFKKPTGTKAALAKRLAQFSAGCQTLIDAEHPQLSPTDRDWLVERCGVWKDKIDTQLAQLNSGTKSLNEVRSEANATVNKLIEAIQKRQVSV